MKTRNLATADFRLLRNKFLNGELDGAYWRWDNWKFEMRIEVELHCWPMWEVTIGPVDKRKKRPLVVKSRFLMQPTEWTQEALTSALMLNHADELKLMGIEYTINAEAIELPENLMGAE